MSTTFTDKQAAAPAGAAHATAERSTPRNRLLDQARAVRQGYLQVFGIPDYERYVAHAASHHPDAPVLSRREFYLQAMERKYGRNGPRCC